MTKTSLNALYIFSRKRKKEAEKSQHFNIYMMNTQAFNNNNGKKPANDDKQ